MRRIPMGAWLASRRGGGVSPRSGRPIAAGVGFRTWCAARLPAATLISAAPYRGARCSRPHVASVSRNRGRFLRRDAVFRIHHRRGRIWRATIKTAIIKTAIIKTWGGATAHANGYDGSCGGEREQTHNGLLLPWRRSFWFAPAGPLFSFIILKRRELPRQSPRKGIVSLG